MLAELSATSGISRKSLESHTEGEEEGTPQHPWVPTAAGCSRCAAGDA